mmetsp:Transcript_86601/g.244914  ORF Transcript_86601/g.244914 Transcript_86601/m.244914 type:complete len:474 (+) Transcript_86601:2738-4159(+)
MAKVSILVGGPDWPTSVMCGIMGLPLLPVLVGTLPVALLIIPTVLSGSFTYLGSLGTTYGTEPDEGVDDWPSSYPDWAWCSTAASLAMTLTAGVQTGSMFLAAHYLSKEIDSVSKNTREILVKLLSNKNMMAPGSNVKSGDFLVNLGFDEEADGAELVEELNKFFTDKSSSLEMPPTVVQDNNIQTVEELISVVSIELMPLDQEVVEADGMASKMAERYADLRQWQNLPCGIKGLLIVATILMSITMCAVNAYGERCFVDFQLTSDVKKDLPCQLCESESCQTSRLADKDSHCGNVLYFSTLEGDVMLCIYATSTLLMIIFNNYMGCKMSGDNVVKDLRVAKKEGEKLKKNLKAAGLAVAKAEKLEAPPAELGPLRAEVTRCEEAVEEQKKVVKKLIGMADEEEYEPMADIKTAAAATAGAAAEAEAATATAGRGNARGAGATLGEVGEAKAGDDEEPFAVDEKGLDGEGPEL